MKSIPKWLMGGLHRYEKTEAMACNLVSTATTDSEMSPDNGMTTDSPASADSVTSSDPFPFMKLPPELRIMIYRLVVVTGQDLTIRGMLPGEFRKTQCEPSYRYRTTYLALERICGLPGSEHNITTYTLDKLRLVDTMTTTMLSLDKGSRAEVASIFYGENTFHFVDMSALIPFMKDRTEQTRPYIKRVRLTLNVDHRDWDAVFVEYGRPAMWNKAFSSLLKLSHLNITKVCITIDDRRDKILVDGLKLRSRSMLWLQKLGKLRDLEMLGLEYKVEEWQHGAARGPHGLPIQEIDTDTEQELWRFLAPQMLKKKTDDHTPDALQQRRIWDFSHNGLSYQNLRVYDVLDDLYESSIEETALLRRTSSSTLGGPYQLSGARPSFWRRA